MSYLIYFGMMLVAGGGLLLASDSFAHSVSRGVEAMFDWVEYRLASRAHERRMLRREAPSMNATVSVTTFRAAVEGQRKGSTQQLGVARIAA